MSRFNNNNKSMEMDGWSKKNNQRKPNFKQTTKIISVTESTIFFSLEGLKEEDNFSDKKINQSKQTIKTTKDKKDTKTISIKHLLELNEKILEEYVEKNYSNKFISYFNEKGLGLLSKDDFAKIPSYWYDISEIENILRDEYLIQNGRKPQYSDTLAEKLIIINTYSTNRTDSVIDSNFAVSKNIVIDTIEDTIENKTEYIAPDPKMKHELLSNFALVCEWEIVGVWKTETVAVFNTVEDYWIIIDSLTELKTGLESKLSLPLTGKDYEANKIFMDLMNSGKKSSDDEVNIHEKNRDLVKKIVSRYNSLHPVWSFIRIPDNFTKENKIEVPFVRVNKRAINDLTVNLKDTKASREQNLHVIDPKFEDGYISCLIIDFVRGGLPNYISAIVFSKTIGIKQSNYFRGYRLRILPNTGDVTIMKQCKDFIENDFIKSHTTRDFKHCVINITIPK